jgi:hypothetical protein
MNNSELGLGITVIAPKLQDFDFLGNFYAIQQISIIEINEHC